MFGITNYYMQFPIDSIESEFKQKVAEQHMVVQSATGSGKSTRLPVWMSSLQPFRRVLVVQPRRVACLSLASFVSYLENQQVGEAIGYSVRFEQQFNQQTRILFATPGVVLRWLANDALAPFSFDAVLLDEFHERRWDTDLILALLKKRNVRIVVTSATIQSQRIARYLGAELLITEGRQFPVTVHHTARDKMATPSERTLIEQAEGAFDLIEQRHLEGDILFFLPGKREIKQVQDWLSAYTRQHGKSWRVKTLHGQSSLEDQQQALNKQQDERTRRIVLSTNVAETSLTIPNIKIVIDSGLERRTHHQNGKTVLGLHAISKASAEQRKGRAGRVSEGHCIRLWGEAAPLDEVTPPDIMRDELTEFHLAALVCGSDPRELDFVDSVPPHQLERSDIKLKEMEAVDERAQLTDHGRKLFELPIDTFYSHLISVMPTFELKSVACDVTAALVHSQRLYTLPRDERGLKALSEWEPLGCDLTLLIKIMCESDWPVELKVDKQVLQEARQLAMQIRKVLNLKSKEKQIDFNRALFIETCFSHLPKTVFVRREKRKQALGNGDMELVIGDQSRFREECEAAIVLNEFHLASHNRQSLTIGTCFIPIQLQQILRAGLAQKELGKVDLEDGEPVSLVNYYYANRKIATVSETITTNAETGEHFHQAIINLISKNKTFPGLYEHLSNAIDDWKLYKALNWDESSNDAGHFVQQIDPKNLSPELWLSHILESLGVMQFSELELLEAQDFDFPGIPTWQRESFHSQFPRQLNLGDLQLSVEYDAKKKWVTLNKLSGLRKTDPKRWELPSWQGWKVRFKKASRIVQIDR